LFVVAMIGLQGGVVDVMTGREHGAHLVGNLMAVVRG